MPTIILPINTNDIPAIYELDGILLRKITYIIAVIIIVAPLNLIYY